MGRGGWDDPRARATRGRGLPSLDARSWDHPSHPLLSDSSPRPCLGQGASLGEEAVLADSGRAGEVAARVGRVRSLAFLSILPRILPLPHTHGPLNFHPATIVLPQPASCSLVR